MADVYACECGSRVFAEVRLATLDAGYDIPEPPFSGYVRHIRVVHLCVDCGEAAKSGMDVATVPDSEDPFLGVTLS